MAVIRTRFAPSPTGFMHIGNLRTALYEYLIARSKGGQFILRIEDTDQGRYVEGAMDAVLETLRMTESHTTRGLASAAIMARISKANARTSIWNMQSSSSSAGRRIIASAQRSALTL